MPSITQKKGEGRIRDNYRDLDVKKIRFEAFQVLYRGFKNNKHFQSDVFCDLYVENWPSNDCSNMLRESAPGLLLYTNTHKFGNTQLCFLDGAF